MRVIFKTDVSDIHLLINAKFHTDSDSNLIYVQNINAKRRCIYASYIEIRKLKSSQEVILSRSV